MGEERLRLWFEREPFSAPQWEVTAFTLTERLGKPSRLELSIAARQVDFEPESLLREPLTVTLSQGGRALRQLSGVVTAVDEDLSPEGSLRAFTLTVGPRLALLGLAATPAVFVDLTLRAIVTETLARHGLGAKVSWRCERAFAPLPQVVQYDETDLAFVLRLCEAAGITVLTDMREADGVVFVDHMLGFEALPEPVTFSTQGLTRGVYALSRKLRAVSGAARVRDHHAPTPTVRVEGQRAGRWGGAEVQIEQGRGVASPAEALQHAALRVEASDATFSRYEGLASQVEIAAGYRVVIEGHPRVPATPLLVVSATLSARALDDSLESPTVRFECLGPSVPWRPARETPRPHIAGLVVGHVATATNQVEGDEAALDAEGRYLVRFQFDTRPHPGRPPSTRLRRLQPHAGNGYGMHLPLKPGTEVMVAFVDGDPDRPVVVGAVHDGANRPMVGDQNHLIHRLQTQSGIHITLKDD
ncbi:MAG: type VI secretion system tip protein VgrG [Myxococcales bacterium]|nr:type VI secretion system tip protein VgrG [Myxococcales bacterium]